MVHQNSLLISCVGAYDDSGVGTGGFVCVHGDKVAVIDKMDCTGLYQSNGIVYRFVRAIKALVSYDENGIRQFLRLPSTKDVHDIIIIDNNIVCASTGQNEICWFDPFGNLLKTWKAKGERDAWHLNCLCAVGDQLFASAFGEFANHREWNGNSIKAGFIFNLSNQEKILDGLSGPHSPRYIDGMWIVCESHIQSLTIAYKQGEKKSIKLNGFTRGLAYDNQYLYIGESANRKDTIVRDHSFVTILDRKTLEVVSQIVVPFPEIYEILVANPGMTEKMSQMSEKFIFDIEHERIASLESQVERGFEETELLRHQLTHELSYRMRKWIQRLTKNLGI